MVSLFPLRSGIRPVFVTAKQLAAVLPRVQLVDARYSLLDPIHYGRAKFAESHAARSVFAELETPYFCGPTHSTTARHPLPEAGNFIDWCARHRIGTAPPAVSLTPVCYDDQGGGLAATRVWWMLHDLGIEAYVLDGGWGAYLAAGLPIESGASTLPPPAPRETLSQWIGKTAWQGVVPDAAVLDPANLVVDGRTADRFGSTVRPFGLDTLPGRLPNSANAPWNANLFPSNGKPAPPPPTPLPAGVFNQLKPEDTLRAQMKAAYGGRPLSETVFMCASGVTACMNVAVSTHLGFGTPRLYPGSWSELTGNQRDVIFKRALEANGGMLVETVKANLMGKPFDAQLDDVTINGRKLLAPIALDRLPALVKAVVSTLKTDE